MQPSPTAPLESLLRPKLRLLSAVGIAGVATGVLVQMLGSEMGARVPAAMANGQVLTLPVLWVPMATLLATVAWTYLLLGALHSPLYLRLVVGGGWAMLAWPFVKIGPLFAAPGSVAVLALLTWRGWARPLVDFGPREGLVLGLPAFATFIGAAVASLREPDLPLLSYNAALSGHFAVFALVALPLLVLAGNDLAEIAVQAGGRAIRLTSAWSDRRLAWVVAALGILQAGYIALGGVRLEPGFWLTILWGVGLLWMGRRLPQAEYLTEPPFLLLVGLMLLALAVPIGGVLLVALLPASVQAAVPVTGFFGSALVASGASLALRPWLERRWPGAWIPLLVGALWMAWLIAGGAHLGWGPQHRALQLALACGAVMLAVRALRRRTESGAQLRLALEALVVLMAIALMQAADQHDLDPADLFTALQVVVIAASALWVGVPRRRLWIIGVVLVGGALLLWLRPSLGSLRLPLMGIGLIWGIVAAQRRMGELLGEGKVQVHLTFLLIGFSLMSVAVLGWNRSLEPAPEALTDFGYLAQFGLVALGLPLYLLSVVQRFHRSSKEREE